MEKLKRLIEILSNISNTEPLDNRKYKNIKFNINKLFNPSHISILRLEEFCGLNNPSSVCYFNSAIQLLFRIDTLISLLAHLKTLNSAKVLNTNYNQREYKTDLEQLSKLKIELEKLKINIVNDIDIDKSYVERIKIDQDIEKLQSKLNIIFDINCKNDNYNPLKWDINYGKFVLENLVEIYNNYKSNIGSSLSLNSTTYEGNSIFNNLIEIAFNLDTTSRSSISDQQDTGEFISNLFRKLSCVDNELVINFMKSIQYQIHSTYKCIVSGKESDPSISLDCLLQIKFEKSMIIPGKLAYTFQELIELYQTPEIEILNGIQDFCNPISKEDYIAKVKLSNILDEEARTSTEKRQKFRDTQISEIAQHYKESMVTRKPFQDQIDTINAKYTNKANNKKLKILIPDELEYLILSVTRQDYTRTAFHPYQIIDNKFEIDGANFILKAVIIHNGGISGGHYVCAICDDNGIPTTLISDSSVSQASPEDNYIKQIPTKGVTYLFRRTN
jgi:hypothetical protein